MKALTQFPSVLANLAKNLSWTSSLGEAYQHAGGGCDDGRPGSACESLAAGN